MQLPAPFGRYQLLRRIAQGGMADVFLARTFGVEGFEKRLVVKRILPGLARSRRFVNMFITEARIAVSLNHPNIVQVYELGREDDAYYIAMEHINGRDLQRVIKLLRPTGERLPLHLALYVVVSALRALGYAHARIDGEGVPLGIVHGDVSPHNLAISFAGDVKLLDFGIARIAGSGMGDDHARPGGGKFAYMSPEQARGGAPDPRADLFAAGIVLYELLVGHRLYDHPDPDEKLRRVLEAEIPDPRPENPEITDALWEILQRALARDPDRRYQRVSTFEEDLRAFVYANRLEADATAMAAYMRSLFGEDSSVDPAAGDLMRLADDLRMLEERSAEPTEPPGAPSSGPATAGAESPSPAPFSDSEPGVPSSAVQRLARVSEELKQVAAIAVELCGYTDVSEDLDPARIVEHQRAIRSLFRRKAGELGGHLREGADDTISVLFGVPRAREDDLQRAATFALELRARLADLEQRRGRQQVCMGLHYGEVAVTYDEEGREPEVVGRGDTLKLPRWLAGSAEFGEIRVSERVRDLLGSQYRLVQAPAVSLRNRRRSLRPWLLEGTRTDLHPQTAGRWLVRGRELEILRDALVALGEGEARVLHVTGETGSGKSRFIQEVAGLARNRGLPVYVTRAYPGGMERPLSVFRDLLTHLTGLEPTDDSQTIRKKLSRLSQLGLSAGDIAIVNGLFATDPQYGRAPSLDMLMETARRLVRGLAMDGPATLVVEDVGFLGRREFLLLVHVARSVRDRPVLLLLSDVEPPGEALAPLVSSTIELGPLDREAEATLVADLMGGARPDPHLVSQVHANAGGNPLFTVELVQALERAGCIRHEGANLRFEGDRGRVRIPHTLRGLVSARLDALDPASRGVLQMSAAMGMAFPLDLLREATGLDDLEAVMGELLESGLLVETQQGSEGRLAFASQLIWDVASRRVLGVQRREHHRMIAQGMRRLYGSHLDPHLDALARHEAGAGNFLDAARLVSRAGDLHRRGAFLEEALACYQLGLDWLQEHRQQGDREPGTRAEGEVVMQLRAGEVALLLARRGSAERYLQLALDQAEEHGFGDLVAEACLGLGRFCLAEGRLVEARAYLEQARAPADAHGVAELELLQLLGELAWEEGDEAGAREIYGRVLEAAGEDSPVAAQALLGLANRCLRADELDAAMGFLVRARQQAEKAGDRILIGRVVNNIGIVYHGQQRYEEALECFREALEVRKGAGYRRGVVINLHNIGDTHLRLGNLDRAYVAFEQSATRAKEIGWTRGVAMNEVFLGYLEMEGDDPEGGRKRLEQGIATARQAGAPDNVATGLGLLARVEQRAGEAAKSAAILDEAMGVAEEAGALLVLRELRRGAYGPALTGE